MAREFGPLRLKPLDLVIATTALQLIVGKRSSLIKNWGILLVCAGALVVSQARSDSTLLWMGLGLPVLLFVVLPVLRGMSRPAFTLAVTDRGLLVRTSAIETLYLRVDVRRVRTVLGRMLIPISGQSVLVVPIVQIGEEAAIDLRRQVLALPFIG